MSKPALAMLLLATVATASVFMRVSPSLAQYRHQPAPAQPGPGPNDLTRLLSDIRGVTAQLEARMKTTIDQLNKVTSLTRRAQEAEVNTIFSSIRQEVSTVLAKLGPNGDLMDALTQAREGLTEFKKSVEMEPPSPEREATLRRFEAQIAQFDDSTVWILDGRAMAQQQLHGITNRHRKALRDVIEGEITIAQEAIRAVLGDLQSLTQVLSRVADSPIPPRAGVWNQ